MQRIREMTKGGVDYSFECAGNLDVLREAFLSTHEVFIFFYIYMFSSFMSIGVFLFLFFLSNSNININNNKLQGWGFTVTLGIHPTPRMLPIHPMELFDGRSIVGSIFGGFKGKTQLPHFAQECKRGVTHSLVHKILSFYKLLPFSLSLI